MSLLIKQDFNESEKCWDFKVGGEVDISNADELRTALNDAYDNTNADFKINLSDLSYMDSTGLGVIIGLFGKVKKDGYVVTLIEPRDNVKKLLRITSLDKVLL
jgi:anti-sigma B factor antagonist